MQFNGNGNWLNLFRWLNNFNGNIYPFWWMYFTILRCIFCTFVCYSPTVYVSLNLSLASCVSHYPYKLFTVHFNSLQLEPIVEKLRFFIHDFVEFWMWWFLVWACGYDGCDNSRTVILYSKQKKNVLLPSHIAHSNVLSLQRNFVATIFSSNPLSVSGIRWWKKVSDIEFRIEFK